MSTTVAPTGATPQDGSLDSAAQAFAGLLSVSMDAENQEPAEREPEQQARPKKDQKATSAEQAPTAPEGEEETPADASEPAEEVDAKADEESEQPEQPQTFTVRINGKEETVTLDELRNGYSRQKDYTTKTMELAKTRREWEEREVAAVRQEREQYRTALVKIEEALQDMTPKEPNWAQLSQTLPPEQFKAEVIAWNANKERLDAVRAERQRVEQQQQQDATTELRKYVEDQRTKLIEADPDFGDPTKTKQLNDEMCQFAISKGFTPEEVANVVDHRLVLVLKDAMRYQQLKAKQPAVKNKLEQVITTATPGGSRQHAPRPSKSDQALSRLRQSGSVDDAAAAFMDRI